jgi:hypothetical protein
VGITLQGNYNVASYGTDVDEFGQPFDYGGPQSSCVLAQLSYERLLDRTRVGFGVGGAVYSTPRLRFESDSQDEAAPNLMVFTPTASLWLTDRRVIQGHSLQYELSGALLPKVDRLAGDINPRIRGNNSITYTTPFHVRARLDMDAAIELGDGRPLGPEVDGEYFSPGARQYAGRVSVGYAYAPWAGIDLGARYQNVETESRSDRSVTKLSKRWMFNLDLSFNLNAVK